MTPTETVTMTSTKTIRARLRTPAPWAIALLVVVAACGSDSGPEPIPDDDPLARRPSGRRASPQASQQQRRPTQRGEAGAFASYEKVDSELRRELTDREFRVDPTGVRNRDPFRSYVITQEGLTSGARVGDEARDRTEVCGDDNSVAIDHSLRDLSLIGIVLRGTMSYAMFRDRRGMGYIVHRNDCLGSEQAVVRRIGSGFVQVETVAQAAQGTVGAAPQQREILLYPEEFDLPPEESE
jgi:hypothetical protein